MKYNSKNTKKKTKTKQKPRTRTCRKERPASVVSLRCRKNIRVLESST